MADLKAKLIRGDRFSAEDTLEIKFTYTGAAQSCDQYLELVSGVSVTHGGGVSASTRLHYKSVERDADGDGIIDYSSSKMTVAQTEKGTSVIKVCADVILKKDYDAYITAYEKWKEENMVTITLQDKTEVEVYKEDPTEPPEYPTATVYKSGEITLEWSDDSFK
jgi:hypothetical protein